MAKPLVTKRILAAAVVGIAAIVTFTLRDWIADLAYWGYWIRIFRDLAVGIGALGTALVALWGVDTWNRQLKGTARYEVARRFSKQILLLEHEAKSVISSARRYMKVLENKPESSVLGNLQVLLLESSSRMNSALDQAKLDYFDVQPLFGSAFDSDWHTLSGAVNTLNFFSTSALTGDMDPKERAELDDNFFENLISEKTVALLKAIGKQSGMAERS